MPAAGWIAAGGVAAATAALAVVLGRFALRAATRRVLERESRAPREELSEFLGELEAALEDESAGPRPASPIDEITFCIKAFHRPSCVARLIKSIKSSYPSLRVRVADDGCVPLFPDGWQRAGVSWHVLPYDTGISVGRNRLLDLATTRFVVTCDDDNLPTAETDLLRMHDFLVRSGFDLVGGARRPTARFRREGDRLLIEVGHPPVEVEPGVYRTDRTSTFCMALTERMRALRWNDDLKLLEHTEFFYRAWKADWRVAEMPDVAMQEGAASCLAEGRWKGWLTYKRFRNRLRMPSRILRRLTRRPYLPAYDRDGLRQVKTIHVG
jgi:hypothetical protein